MSDPTDVVLRCETEFLLSIQTTKQRHRQELQTHASCHQPALNQGLSGSARTPAAALGPTKSSKKARPQPFSFTLIPGI